jgi:hypothetical protein
MIHFRGAAYPSLPAENIKITDNLGIPVPEGSGNGILLRAEGYYGENIVIRGNTQWGDSSATVSITPSQMYRVMAHPVVEWNDEFVKTSQGTRAIGYSVTGAAVAGATHLRGQMFVRSIATSGAPNSWHVTSEGTDGSISGVTGSISAASTTLALTGNDATKAFNGSYVNIAGAGVAGATLTARIVAISDDFATATLGVAASTTVSGAAVSRKTPTISAGAVLS